MRPTQFPEANRLLGGNGYKSENVSEVTSLPVWTDGELCVSCWRLSWRERISAALFGKVYISVLSGSTQPPIAARATRRYFVEAESNP